MNKAEFLKTALEYSEKRIEVIDQKASILMAIQAGYFVLVSTVAKGVLGGDSSFDESAVAMALFYFFLIVSFSLAFFVVYFLIMTIRPGRSKKIDLEGSLSCPGGYVLWFKDNGKSLTSKDYSLSVDQLSHDGMVENLKMAHFSSLSLLKKKYYYYRFSTLGMRWFVGLNAFYLVGFLLFVSKGYIFT
ncbi:hypothetical protein P8631_00225 [Guyparkeria sp. 1SP6A2]|nr:hypothetical protein [Guyparkeria sp. 1SP6A2]